MLKALILNLFVLLHPVHVTLTTVNQAQDNDTLKVFFRMYYDDFQRDYKLYYPELNQAGNDETANISNEMLSKYFNNRVKIYVNHRLLSGKLVDFTTDSYEIRLNVVYRSDKRPKNFRIRNQILIAVYGDQANMVYLNIGKYENAISLTADNVEETISLK
jgi:hypothetical protein